MTGTTKTISLVLIGSGLVFAAWRYVKPAEDDKEPGHHSTTGSYHGGGGHVSFWPTSSGSHGGGPSSGQHGGASARGGFGSTCSGVGA
jgi:hypothetical protein